MFLLRQGGRVDYNYKEYYLDTEDELSLIPVADCCPGSIAYIIENGKVYMLNSENQWKEQ